MDPLEENRGWEALVTSHPSYSFFHSVEWARVLIATYGHKPAYLAYKNTAGQDMLPLMEVNSALTGKRGVSLPFTDSVPPLATDNSSFARMLSDAIAFGKQNSWRYIELRGITDLWVGSKSSLQFWGHNLDLGGGPESVFQRFDPSVRRAIRKAEKEGVQVEVSGTANAVDDFYGLHCRTRRKHGLPPQPFSFFRNILNFVLAKGLGFVVTARWKNQPIASAMFFHFGQRAIYKFGASDENFQHLRASNLVMWHAIEWYATRHYESLDFGRTSLANDGLRRFKQGWGSREFQINYFKYDLRKDVFTSHHDNSSGWHSALFARSPLWLLNVLGRILYRHMS